MSKESSVGKIVLRIITRLLIILLIIAIGGLIYVGNYFSNYLLQPDSESNVRDVENTLEVVDVTKTSSTERSSGYSWASSSSYDEAEITTNDNYHLYGRLYKGTVNNHKYIIMCHPYKEDMSYMYSYAKRFCEKGYSVLLVDMRGHGESEGKYVGMGYLDAKDISQWADYIAFKDPDSYIALFGLGMGASAVLYASDDNLSSQVVGIVADSSYTSLEELVKQEAEYRFPEIPIFPVYNLTSFMTKTKAGFTIEEANVTDSVKNSKYPILFIQGTADDFTTVAMGDELYSAADCTKEQYIVEGADHLSCKDINPGTYINTVDLFLEKCLKNK